MQLYVLNCPFNISLTSLSAFLFGVVPIESSRKFNRSVKYCFFTHQPSKCLDWVPLPRSLWWLLGAQSGWVEPSCIVAVRIGFERRAKKIAFMAVVIHLTMLSLGFLTTSHIRRKVFVILLLFNYLFMFGDCAWADECFIFHCLMLLIWVQCASC